ncbi:MAG: threonylcarbamoyl-AMP synthase [Ignavibacteriales bacterium]|nr:threonylcarbamoyl-AMP synthase [Ignavibacteriales bacterium]MCF8305355.1 threonylcarbamoyl-AMP synthase [Ignavibacteriales bacterium]MCF8436540.1 threonylcarbamoyl-AMP synthase [Ignavibacteriales bacterium]
MDYYELHPVNPQARYINKAIETLKNGGVIIYPTDTLYGIGCDIFNRDALERVYLIKNEPNDKLFSFIIPDLKEISNYARVSDYAYKAMKKLLPGPYTFILPAAKEVPKKLWSKRSTVGIRIPAHPVAINLVRDLGHPIISTSVTNRKGEPIYDPEEIRVVFNPSVDLMLSVGHLEGVESTVVDLSGDEADVIREGAGDTSFFE